MRKTRRSKGHLVTTRHAARAPKRSNPGKVKLVNRHITSYIKFGPYPKAQAEAMKKEAAKEKGTSVSGLHPAGNGKASFTVTMKHVVGYPANISNSAIRQHFEKKHPGTKFTVN